MAYGLRYKIEWKARFDDILYFHIFKKDYTGTAVTELIGDKNVCEIEYPEDDPFAAFKTSTCKVQYRNENNMPLSTFYSEDDEMYLGKLIDASDGSTRWAGFMVQDECSEEFAPVPYVVSLTFTDNLALLKGIPYNESLERVPDAVFDYQTRQAVILGTQANIVPANSDYGLKAGSIVTIAGVEYPVTQVIFHTATDATPSYLELKLLNSPGNPGLYDITFPVSALTDIIGKPTLWSFLRLAILNTRIPLPVRCFNSLYEVTHDTTKNMFDQTRIFSGKWLSEESAWSDLYSICQDILSTFNASIVQADGYWNIIRWGEAYRYTDNELYGHSYDENFMNEQVITLQPNFDVIRPGTDVELVEASALHRIQRPYKDVIETFKYEQPKQLIKGSDLQTLGAFLSTETQTIEGVQYRFDRYELPPYWKHFKGDTSYIEIKTQIAATVFDTDSEVDRYVVTPRIAGEFSGVEFNTIEVTKGDYFDFTTTWAAFQDSNDFLQYGYTFILYGTDGIVYYIFGAFFNPEDPDTASLLWDKYLSQGEEYPPAVVFQRYSNVYDITQYTPMSLSSFGRNNGKELVMPADGMLKIIVHGTNQFWPSPSTQTVKWKEITLSISNRINDSLNVVGQVHTDSANPNVKNNYDEEITIDDSPRNTIAGTLFRNTIYNFGYNIGDAYFNRTTLWNFINDPKTQRLGQYITHERHILRREVRNLIDCDFVFDCPLLTPMNVLFISSILNINFIFGVCRFNMMDFRCSATLWELHKDGESGWLTTYNFKYLYQTS